MKNLRDRARDSISTATSHIRDIELKEIAQSKSVRDTTDWAKDSIEILGKKSTEVLHEAVNSNTAKDIASFAAVGAVLAVPIPLIGPLTGAAIGACAGIYKNITHPKPSENNNNHPKDIYEELLKLEELRSKKILSQTEFEEQKSKILKSR